MKEEQEEAKNIVFNNLKLQFKSSQSEFKEINFKTIYEINNLKTFWDVYNNSDFLTCIQFGSLFLSSCSPIWNPNNGTFSFIVSNSNSEKQIDEVWRDLSVFFLTHLLNSEKENDVKIEGVSVTLKGRERNIYNLKITSNSTDPQSINFDSLPLYFGRPKFLVNAERQSSVQGGFEVVKGVRGRGRGRGRGGRRRGNCNKPPRNK